LESLGLYPFPARPVDVAPPLTTHGAEGVIGNGSPLNPATMNFAESL
jgi:hypothetical protein